VSGGTEGRFVAPGTREPFGAGEVVLLRDARGRRSLVTLVAGGTWHSNAGAVAHDDLIGRAEGTAVRTPRGTELVALRPTREDVVLKMPRGAQVVYPKDQAMIVALADVRPGMTVAEAGAGSGALTLALLDAVGPEGHVVSIERREDHAAVARANVERFRGGPPPKWDLRTGDAVDLLPGLAVHRVVLDLPEPWVLVGATAEALAPGGVVLTYLPSIVQVARTTEALRDDGRFADVTTTETLVRPWDVDGAAVRPAHRMVAHTAFLTRARRVPRRDEGGPAAPRRRGVLDGALAGTEPSAEDGPGPAVD
jgi:tRNA (adenine57-N1/adenine58-N1)-methyltransferase